MYPLADIIKAFIFPLSSDKTSGFFGFQILASSFPLIKPPLLMVKPSSHDPLRGPSHMCRVGGWDYYHLMATFYGI